MNPGLLVLFLAIVLSILAYLIVLLNRRFSREDNGADDYTMDHLLKDTGYGYDTKQNIFFSINNAWQRRFGYWQLFDETAVTFGLVFDCEPIRFEYGGKKWLIELTA